MASIRSNLADAVEHAPTLSQYFDRVHGKLFNDPERRLMFAVLIDAWILFQLGKGRAALEAEAWFRGWCDPYRLSFAQVCEALDLNSEWLARGILKVTETVMTVEEATSQKRKLQISRRQHRSLSNRRVYRKRTKRGAQNKRKTQSKRCAAAA